MRFSLLAALPALIMLCASTQAQTAPVVKTDKGAIQGAAADGLESFKGIPFAAPPVGNLRWHAPVENKGWDGVRDATRFGHDCMQIEYPTELSPLQTKPDEDCLYLNVWRPAGIEAGADLPILVWIYGGGFVNGGTSAPPYSGAPMARKGLVVVSMNYRLGRFGFFAHPAITAAKEGPVGNWGLMDQHAALKWIQRNAKAFGGNPDEVTIMGESAGAMSVLSLMGAPTVYDTFDRAIVMSGFGRGREARQLSKDLPNLPSSETLGLRFAENLGIKGIGPDALKRLRALSTEDVLGGMNIRTGFSENFASAVVDGITLTDSVENTLTRGDQAKVPLIIGATTADLSWMNFKSKEEAFATFGDDAAAARQDYDPTGDATVEELSTIIGSDFAAAESSRFDALQVQKAGQPAYYYRFSYIADKDKPSSPYGAKHASDVVFFLDTAAARYGEALTPTDAAVASTISEYIANFARTGVPSADGHPKWPVIGLNDTMMDFSESGAMIIGTDPWKSRMDRVEGVVDSEK